MINDFLDNLGSSQYQKEPSKQKLINEIEKLAQQLDASMQKTLRCDSAGRQSRVITIEYDVKETK